MWKKSLILCLLVSLSWLYAISETKVSFATSNTCKEAVVLFARGSGQPINAPEETALKEKLSYRVAPGAYSIDYLPLAGSYLGTKNDYPAEDVAGESLRSRTNAISAELNWTAYLTRAKYPQSVESGVATLREYFENQITSGNLAACPNTRYVLAGYSQGAEVIGNTLEYLSTSEFEQKISFVALFGDPKYKSKGIFSAANGQPTYPWYRGDIEENTTFNGGVNDPRNPYIPDIFEGRVGSWCRARDPICNGNGLDLFSEQRVAHETYPDESMDEAADEIASALKRDFASAGLPDRPRACGAAEQDIVLAMDMSDSMRSLDGPYQGDNPKKFAEDLFSTACDVRVSIVGYGHTSTSQPGTYLDFTTSKVEVARVLSNLALPAQGTPNAPQFTEVTPTDARTAMTVALDSPWRPSAQKALMVVTNISGTGYPEGMTSYIAADKFKADTTTQSVIQKSRDKGGVEIYNAIVPYPWYMNIRLVNPGINAPDYFVPFNEATGGTMLPVNCGTYCYWSDVRMVNFKNKPKLKVPSITAQAGTPIKIEALDISGNVISAATRQFDMQYDWYVDCQGATTRAWGNKTLEYTFATAQQCTGAVVTKAFGRYCYFCGGAFGRGIYDTSVATFDLTVLPADYVPPAAPPAPESIQNVKKSLQNGVLTITWDPPANAAQLGDIAYVIRDQDGSFIGTMTATKLLIKDLPEDSEADISIAAISATASGTPVDSSTVPTEIITPEAQVMNQPLAASIDKIESTDLIRTSEQPQKTPSRFDFPLNDGVSLPARTSTPPEPLAIPAVKDPITSVAKINTEPARGNGDSTTAMPAWLLGGLLLIFSALGIKIASVSLSGAKR